MVDSLLTKQSRFKARGSALLVRTVLLGTIAAGLGIYWLADAYGVEQVELLEYLRASLLFVAVFALTGVLAGGCLWLIKRLTRR